MLKAMVVIGAMIVGGAANAADCSRMPSPSLQEQCEMATQALYSLKTSCRELRSAIDRGRYSRDPGSQGLCGATIPENAFNSFLIRIGGEVMWLMMNDCFLSIVAKDCKEDELLVRARRPGDIERVFGEKTKVARTLGL